jgi:two-component system cell cycle sensor histidine kinase/response regulator CckA
LVEKHARLGSEGAILVVDDDGSVLEFARRTLDLEGYRVTTARSAEEAVAILSHAENDVDVLVTDISMPNVTGLQLARHVRRLAPATKIVFMSGGHDRRSRTEGDAWVQKPFTPDELLERLQSVLQTEAKAG